jgi:hypothetical protein
MSNTNNEWNKLKYDNCVGSDNEIYNQNEKRFMVRIYQDNFQYVKKNYYKITNVVVQNESFIIATTYSKNINLIKFLFEEFKINTSYQNDKGYNCLTSACKNNTLPIIKFLVEELKMNINNSYNSRKNSCLMLACSKNSLDVIKYLVEECNANVNHSDSFGFGCMSFISSGRNDCGEVAKYLIENTEVEDLIGNLTVFKKCIPLIKNRNIIDILLKRALGSGGFKNKNDIYDIMKKINPFLLSKKLRDVANIKDPYDEKFEKFKQYVNQLEDRLDFISFKLDRTTGLVTRSVSLNKYFFKKPDLHQSYDIDFSKRDELLFIHNKISYFGKRNIVYESIDFLKDLDLSNFDEGIVLGSDMQIPQYIINMYIHSCYTGIFNINKIQADDMNVFIKFIDRYPSKYVSINILQDDIIKYFNNHELSYDVFIKDICERYQLKPLYIAIHNKKF